MKIKMTTYLIAAFLVLLISQQGYGQVDVELRKVDDQHKVDVFVGGSFFTSYCYGPEFSRKPVFYPIRMPSGKMVNRGYPMLTDVPGEAHDHPHHESLSFTYGDVNGLDFWSNNSAVKIVHDKFFRLKGGKTGFLEARLDWVTSENQLLLQEIKKVSFGGTSDSRWMDHEMTLTAAGSPVVFGDTKEGAFALRVAAGLKEKGGTGRYINAYGWETAAEVWGKRAPWVAIRGTVGDEEVTVAIFDHPTTVNYPSFWHARDYGLFSANSLGRKDYIGSDDAVTRTLEPGESYHFRYRVVVYQGIASKKRLDDDYWEYVK
jgi:hypothetical protein